MKKVSIAIFIAVLAGIIFTRISASGETLSTEPVVGGEPSIIRCTCYCDQGYTKSGQWVREGIVAGKEEWLGMAAVLYEVEEDGSMGDFIGIYEFLDTGYGINGSLQEGTSIDVYCPTLDACYDWIGQHGDYVYLQIIDGKG